MKAKWIFFPCCAHRLVCFACCCHRTLSSPSILVDVQITWAMGSLFTGVIAWAVLESDYSWRWLALFSAIPPAAVVCCFSFVPESPRWYMANGRPDEAKDTLRTIARRNGIELGDFTLRQEEASLFFFFCLVFFISCFLVLFSHSNFLLGRCVRLKGWEGGGVRKGRSFLFSVFGQPQVDNTTKVDPDS